MLKSYISIAYEGNKIIWKSRRGEFVLDGDYNKGTARLNNSVFNYTRSNNNLLLANKLGEVLHKINDSEAGFDKFVNSVL